MLIECIMPTMSTMFDSYRACQTYHACQSYHVNMPIPCSCTYHADMHAVHVLKYIHAWHVNHAAATNFWTACAIENFNPAQRNSINKTHTHNTQQVNVLLCSAAASSDGWFVCVSSSPSWQLFAQSLLPSNWLEPRGSALSGQQSLACEPAYETSASR